MVDRRIAFGNGVIRYLPGTIGGPPTTHLFAEMTFRQRKGGTKGMKKEIKVGNKTVLCALGWNSVQLQYS
jgi:hypothetical protein